MNRLMRFDKIIGGMASTARSIFYKPKDTSRAATNVQAELDKINDDVSDINIQLNETEVLTITVHGYITSYLSARRFGNRIHLTGAFTVNTALPINTDFLYIQRASGQSGSVVSGEVTQAIVESIGAQPNNTMYMSSNSNHFINNFGTLAVGTYIVDCWYVCKVN